MHLTERFFNQSETVPQQTCFASRSPEGWQKLTWRESAQLVRSAMAGLRAAGVKPGDRVVLLCENRPEWAIFDLAIMGVGALVVPAYTTHSRADLSHIYDLVTPSAIIASSKALTERALEGAEDYRGIEHVWSLQAEAFDSAAVKPWSELLEAEPRDSTVEPGTPDDTCCLIFTSGTSGLPKAAMLTHRSIGANLDAAVRLLSELGVGYDDRFLSFLPMAHAYEHMAGLHLPIALGSELWFCESTDKLQQYLQEAQPSMATAVPRLYDLLHARITAQVKNAPPTKQKLFNAAVTLGRKRLAGEKLSMLESLFDKLLDRLVRKKVKERFGGRIRYFISGGAALNLEVGHFFTSLGLGIIQGYGQTEASPLISVNHPNRVKLHTVGEPMDNVEARLAEDGELLVRGDCVMKGYWEDEKSTQGTIIDGWLHTGDLAVIDEDGYIEIVGRKKDLIVTSGGDNVAPAKIEAALCAHPEIEQAVVFGDGRPWLGAVIIPSPDEGADESQIEACVRQVNQQLNNYERVRKFVIQTEVCSIENGLLTPTQKVKRDKVLAINHEQISALY